MRLLGSSRKLVQLAGGTALLAGDAALGAGRAVAGTATGVVTDVATGAASTARAAAGMIQDAAAGAPAAARTAAAITSEALGGHPVKRTSRLNSHHWIEVCGLSGPDADAIAEEVLASVHAVDGVTHAEINRSVARVIVTTEPAGPAADLAVVVADAERRARTGPCGERHRSLTLPGDDALLAARTLGALAAAVGLGLSVTGNTLRLPRGPDLLSVIPTAAANVPQVRRQFERRLGRDSTDLLLSLMSAASAGLTASPTSAAAEAATRTLLAAEAWHARLAWRRHEPRLAVSPPEGGFPDRGTLEWDYGPGERYSERIGELGLVAAAMVGAVTRNPTIAGSAALVTAPKPSRAAREAFGCAMTRGLTTRHNAVVVRPRALRHLDRLDAIVIDPRTLYTDRLTVTRVVGVTNSRRARAWEAVRAALDADGLQPGWHELATIPGAGRSGKALVSPVRDPLANAVVTEARRTKPRVTSVADDGLRSLAQGFDRLHPVGDSIDEALAAAITELKADGATIALLTTPAMSANQDVDLTIGLERPGRPPWGADVFVPDLLSVWRILHSLPTARAVTARGVRLSVSATALGALMLIPGVPGSGPESVNVGVIGALWSGFTAGNKVFRDRAPEPETTHDWHAMPVTEVQRLLPRPPDEQPDVSTGLADLPPLRVLGRVATWSWHLARDFAVEMRADLADPITPLLATGAVASALLGSPLDAALVGGVLLANAALSAEQQLHAERILQRLMAVEEPLARRRVGPLDQGGKEKVPANRLRPGDIIEVRADEIVPADARLLAATNVEADESTLTGESLPVPKQSDPTPGAPLAERACMLYAGSTLVAGTAIAIVTAVGSRTEMRRALAMAPEKSREIGLQRQLSRITKRALPFSVGGGALVGLLSLARGTPLREAVGSAVALTVAAVPEGLPLVATLAQLASARRLSGESVLIRNAQSIEALARLQVVCFDKTGTLSENRLQVKAVRAIDDLTEEQALDAALTTIYVRPGHRAHHATDDAIRRAVHGDENPAGTTAIERDAFLPFQAGRPFAAAIVGTRLTIKGAPEMLASALTQANGPVVAAVNDMAAKGLRVIAVAERQLTPEQAAAAAADAAAFEELCRSNLTPIGLLGLADTPRESAQEVLKELVNRDIGIRLITGDHPVTAAVIAGELGLAVAAEQVITGADWECLTTDERADAVRSRLVYARMSPEHKIDVVRTLERIGLVTAMVGDGANDAAAIRAASVGVGVAARGSDPARTAADVVLLDGRIEALLDALDEGKQLWRRVQSAVSMLLGGNTGEVTFALVTSLLTGRSVLNARQMLLVNMLTDALPAAALAVSRQTDTTGQVDLDEAAMWRAIGVRGAATTVGATSAWVMARVTGTGQRASTVALIGLVSTQLAQTLIDSRSPLVVLTAAGSFATLAGIISTPGLSQVFGCTPVGPLGWGQAFSATAVAALLSTTAPELLSRATDAVRERIASIVDDESVAVVDDDDAGLHEDGVDGSDRRSE
ncbi:cation-translocating P-type ATPase [Mycolicibacterium sp. ND9-15]|uniref:cation-translocating P-type ATPase n=1 Tax=Mycolicibacterium sp. ND9-15 TaxID=3042320 RepID=UPI002DDADF16|nr:cation-translocating P-type ATPase [Mycolicibacterium sp. ND9-15]WSE57418.1 cation-translocating P-type ATPase [Mycolicibacterium sp. ND9-15]